MACKDSRRFTSQLSVATEDCFIPTEPRGRRLDIGVYGARGIPSTYSGYETFLTALLPALAARGHKITMYCRRGEVPEGGDFSGVRRRFLPAVRTKRAGTLSHGPIAALVARLRRHDVVLVVNVANALYCRFARATGQRIILNTDGQEWLRGKWGPAARRFFRDSAVLAGRSATALVADSVGMRRIYRDEFAADSTVIPYCWTGLEPSESPDRGVFNAIGVRLRSYFLVAGRLNPENNIDKIAEAFAGSSIDQPLVVLGSANYDSPVFRRLTELARWDERILVVGHIADRTAYATLVTRATGYIHGHSVGGINPSLIEAMGCGARVIALDTEFNREALADTGTYFSSFEDLPDALSVAATGDGAEYRIAARARARAVFSLEVVADAYEELMREVKTRRAWDSVTIPTRWEQG